MKCIATRISRGVAQFFFNAQQLERNSFVRRFFVFREDVVFTSGSGEESLGRRPPGVRSRWTWSFDRRGKPGSGASAWILAMSPCAWRRRNNRVTKARLPVFVWCEGIGSARQLPPHVSVRETVQGVFPRQEYLKEHALVARQGIERPDRPAVFGRYVGRQRVEIPHGWSGTLVPGSRHPWYLTLLWAEIPRYRNSNVTLFRRGTHPIRSRPWRRTRRRTLELLLGC